MRSFTQRDLESLKSGNVGKEQVREILPSAIENSEDVRANVRNFDANTGHYEITLIGTLNQNVLQGQGGRAGTGQRAGT